MADHQVPSDVKLFVNKLREHAKVNRCESVRPDTDDYAYLISFSDDCTQKGIGRIMSSMRKFLSTEVGYQSREILQVYDDRSSGDIPELSDIGRYERILVFNFN